MTVAGSTLVDEATDAQVEQAKQLLLFVPDTTHPHHARQKPGVLHLDVCHHTWRSVAAPPEQLTRLRSEHALCQTCVFTATLYVVADAYARLLGAIDPL